MNFTFLLRYFTFLLLFLPFFLLAQEEMGDSIWQAELPGVIVSQNTTSTPPVYVSSIENESEIVRATSLVNALEESGLVFLKTYGLGSLATVSLRGGAAGQTAIVWNGIALQSPMLGLTDLSLIPSIHLDQASVEGGGQSAALGSGAVAGSISFKTQRPDTAWQLLHRFSAGSFGQFSNALRVSGGNDRLRFKLSAQFDKADNDFPYQIREDLPVKRLPHAEFEQQAWQQSIYWKPHPKHSLTAHAWQQSTQRNIPPTTVANTSLATQADDSWRQQIIWQARSEKVVWDNQFAYNKEHIYYQDPLSGVDAPSSFGQLTWQGKRNQQVGAWNLLTGGQYIRAGAEAQEYRQVRTQRQAGVYQQVSGLLAKRLHGSALARLHRVDDRKPLLALNAKLRKELGETWRVYGTLSRDFRVPTLNDLYWLPGGNPDLRTELSWSQEIGLATYHGSDYSLEIVAYNRNVDDWIQWSLQDGNPFWSAGNVTEVWSRGLEFNSIGEVRAGTSFLRFDARYRYTKSTYQEALMNPRIDKGDQLWYTPIHTANLQIGWERGPLLLEYHHRYVSETEGVNEDLTAYQLGDLHFIWRKLEAATSWRAFLEINNLWDADYRVIERRPMPGRHLRIGMQTNFSLKK